MFSRSRRLLQLSLLTILMSALIVACQVSPKQNLASQYLVTETENCHIIEHDAGETEICGIPEKIAVLGPHMLDILLSLGIQPAGYAEWYTEGIGNPVSEIPIFGERVTSNPMSLGLRNTPSLEAIVKLKPDLILGEDFLEQYSNLSAIAPTLLFNGQEDHWKRSIPKISKVFDREEQAQKVIDSHNQKVARLRNELATVVTAYPRVFHFAAFELPASMDLRTDDSISGILLQELGFEVVIPKNQKAQSNNNSISLEVLPQLEADIIIIIVSDYLHDDAMEQAKRFWQENPLTQSIAASKEDRVYFVDYYTWGSNMRGPIAADMILDDIRQLFLPLAEST